jgi:hypothetical protein
MIVSPRDHAGHARIQSSSPMLRWLHGSSDDSDALPRRGRPYHPCAVMISIGDVRLFVDFDGPQWVEDGGTLRPPPKHRHGAWRTGLGSRVLPHDVRTTPGRHCPPGVLRPARKRSKRRWRSSPLDAQSVGRRPAGLVRPARDRAPDHIGHVIWVPRCPHLRVPPCRAPRRRDRRQCCGSVRSSTNGGRLRAGRWTRGPCRRTARARGSLGGG